MKKLVRKRHARLEVEWEDSHVSTTGWQSISDILGNRGITRCHSVGVVLADDKKGLVLASTVDAGSAVGIVYIPRSQVKKVRRLR